MLLELFRNHKRWLMFIAMILVIPSFVVTGIYSYNRMMSDDGAIAKVDDVSITPQQYDEVKRQQLDNLRQRLGENFKSNLLDTAEGRWAVLQSIMNERSLMGEVAKEFVSVPEETAIEVIKTYPAFQENGKFSAELYQNYLASTGYSDQYFVERVRQDVSRQLLTAAFTRTAGAPESVVKEVNKLLTEKRTMEVMAFNADDYKKGVTVTQAQAKDYWTKNPKAFAMPDEADVEYVVFSPELFKNVEPTKQDIETFYAQNRNRFNAPEERRASQFQADAWQRAFTGSELGGIFSAIMLIVTFCLVDMFDTIGTLYGTASQANMLDKNGDPINVNQCMTSDSVATVAGAVCGTSTCTTFVESAAGVGAGGRTGLTSLVVAICFAV